VNGTHYVRVAIDKLQKLLQTPEETLTTTQNGSGDLVIVLFQFLVDVFQHYAYQSAYGYDQGTKSESTDVVPQHSASCV
jgi:hypothetical protein